MSIVKEPDGGTGPFRDLHGRSRSQAFSTKGEADASSTASTAASVGEIAVPRAVAPATGSGRGEALVPHW